MNERTILFETVDAAKFAYDTLQFMIDVSLDFNALTFNRADEELVKWLVQNNYCCFQAYRSIFYNSHPRILLVDDDFNLTMLLQEHLRDWGLQSASAETGEDGWQRYCRYKPDLIISDIAMETIDAGFELLQRVRSDNLGLPFIFLSTYRDVAERIRSLNLGADCSMCKPFEPEELRAQIGQLIQV